LSDKLHSIILGARRKSGTESFSGAMPTPEEVWRKDDFICQFCGFRSEKYQRVVQGNWIGSDRPALTACLFCEQCFSLESLGTVGAGHLIWMPEISQSKLNHLCRAIYVARKDETMAERAQTALDALSSRRSDAKKRLGTDDPIVLGTALVESLSQKEYDVRGKKLEGIRYLPADRYLVQSQSGVVDVFDTMLNYWTSPRGPFAKCVPNDWMNMFVF
jgi:intracellular multiplication protein IcmJ